MTIGVFVVAGRYTGVLVVSLTASPTSSRRRPCRFLLGAPSAYRNTAALDT